MRKARTIACMLILVLTIPAVMALKGDLPPDTQPMIEAKYGGWSGVLRLWVCEDWPVGSGSAATWINRCIASFEKRHPGVYIQPEYVDAGALSAEGLLPPDMALFTPGIVDAERLANLEIDPTLREGLPWDDRAVPVMMGGYIWAYNTGMIEAPPGSWREAGVPIAVHTDTADRFWSAALLALCSSKYAEADDPQPNVPQGEIELGLAEDPSEPPPTPVEGTLRCRLPEDFAPSADAWQRFINGDAAAMPVTAREIRRLEALSDQGRGPDWQLAAAGNVAFTDQVLYIGAFAQESPEKLNLCRAFVAHLLSDDCQGQLNRIGAFSVTDVPSGYPAGDRLVPLERMLSDKPLIVPSAFDAAWRTSAAGIVREWIEDDGDPAPLTARLAGLLGQKAEHSR